MDIKNWNRRKKNNCTNCWFAKEHFGKCELRDDVNHCNFEMTSEYFHYANKDQIESLIEDAEKRHRDKGGLVVCDHAEECILKNGCECSIPHVFDENCHASPEYDNEICCKAKRIAYRGEPAKEENMQDYVVVKSYNIKTLGNSDINLQIFKDAIGKYGEYVANIDFNKEIEYAKELERLNFIEKVVHDPVVIPGDTFTNCDNNFLYRIMTFGNCQYALCNLSGETHYGVTREITDWLDVTLSVFTGHNNIQKFKPVKIKITKVEEG